MSNKDEKTPDQDALKKVSINTATDTGVQFELGNVLIAAQGSLYAAGFSATVAGLCAAARATGESQRAGIFNRVAKAFEPVQKFVPPAVTRNVSKLTNYMSGNLGASLMISGGSLIAAALWTAVEKGMDISSLQMFIEKGKEAAILGLFGAANFIRGHARGLVEGHTQQKIQDVAGISLATMGVLMTGHIPDAEAIKSLQAFDLADLGIKATLVTAAVGAGYEAIKNKPIINNARADLIFAAGCAGQAGVEYINGFSGDSMAILDGLANTTFALAFVSLDALKQKGGFYQQYVQPRTIEMDRA